MDLYEFIKNKSVDFTKNLIGRDDIECFEKDMGIAFGDELVQYIQKFGYLGYKHIELYGINSKQMFDSDMIKQTKYLHEYYPKTTGYIALCNTGDGNYVLVSSQDDVLEYSSEEDDIHETGLKLFDYIFMRFEEIDDFKETCDE